MYFCPISWSLARLFTSLYEKNYSGNIRLVVKFFVCLEVYAYLISNENPIKSTDSLMENVRKAGFELFMQRNHDFAHGWFRRFCCPEVEDMAPLRQVGIDDQFRFAGVG